MNQLNPDMIQKYKDEMMNLYKTGTRTNADLLPRSSVNSESAAKQMPTDSLSFFQAQIFTANQAIPVSGARVTLKRDNNLVAFLLTDENGHSRTIEIPAPPRENTLEAYNANKSTDYFASVSAQGFQDMNDLLVSQVGGATSFLRINLIPVAEGVV